MKFSQKENLKILSNAPYFEHSPLDRALCNLGEGIISYSVPAFWGGFSQNFEYQGDESRAEGCVIPCKKSTISHMGLGCLLFVVVLHKIWYIQGDDRGLQKST